MSGDKLLTEEEIKQVFLTYKNPVFGFIYKRTGNTHDSEDIFSRVFEKFMRYAAGHEVRLETVKSFLFKIASNCVNDFFRHARIIRFISLSRFNREEDHVEYFRDLKSLDAIQGLDNSLFIEKVNKIVSELPDRQKEAFILRFIEGFSFAEIAGIQKSSLSTALSRVRYAVEKIRGQIGGEINE